MTTTTYFITSAGQVKVGKTTNLERRLKEYRTHNPDFELLFTINEDIEFKLHTLLKPYNVKNEWFEVPRNRLFELIAFLNMGKFLLPVSFFDLETHVQEKFAQALKTEKDKVSRVVINSTYRIDLDYSFPLREIHI